MIIKRGLFAIFLGLLALFLGYFLTSTLESSTKDNSETKPVVTVTVPKPTVTVTVPKPTVTVTVPKPTVTIAVPKPTVTVAVLETPIPQALPIEDSIQLDVPLLNQQTLGYMSGCEIVSLGMLINYETKVDIETLVSQMPRSTDPTKGFRGDVKSRRGFTVLPMALTELTAEYLGAGKDMTGCTVQDLKRQLGSNRPIVIWVNGLGFNVHAICLTGYDQDGFFYNDPWPGNKDVFITYNDFYKIWNNPIYDKQLGISYPVRLALSY